MLLEKIQERTVWFMSTKVIGFFGQESYDIIHYTGKALAHVGCNVLAVDASKDLSLAYTFPSHVMQNGKILEYNSIDIARAYELEPSVIKSYDYVLMYFGWDYTNPMIKRCEEVFCFTDCQIHNVQRLKRLDLESSQCRFLVLRNFVTGRFTELIMNELKNLNFKDSNVLTIACNGIDELCKLQVQYDSNFKFQGISNDVVKLIGFMLETEMDPKEFKKILKQIQKGR